MGPLRLLVRQLARFARGADSTGESPAEPAPTPRSPPLAALDTFEPAAPAQPTPAAPPRNLVAAFRADTFSGFVDGFEGAVRAPVNLNGGVQVVVPDSFELSKPSPVAVSTGFTASLDDLFPDAPASYAAPVEASVTSTEALVSMSDLAPLESVPLTETPPVAPDVVASPAAPEAPLERASDSSVGSPSTTRAVPPEPAIITSPPSASEAPLERASDSSVGSPATTPAVPPEPAVITSLADLVLSSETPSASEAPLERASDSNVGSPATTPAVPPEPAVTLPPDLLLSSETRSAPAAPLERASDSSVGSPSTTRAVPPEPAIITLTPSASEAPLERASDSSVGSPATTPAVPTEAAGEAVLGGMISEQPGGEPTASTEPRSESATPASLEPSPPITVDAPVPAEVDLIELAEALIGAPKSGV